MCSDVAVTNAMSVDVEDYFHVAALSSVINPADWGDFEYRVVGNTQRLLDLFAEKQIKATFFVLGWVAQKSPSLVRSILAAGHEVASHGMSHKLVFNQSPDEFRRETLESKALLEDITGIRVSGYRASTYSITRRSLWALDVLAEAGYLYDSSIFPIRHDLYGIRDACEVPSLLKTPKDYSIVEFPMSAVGVLGLRTPVSGGGYFRILPYWFTKMGLAKLNNSMHRPFIFYLHPWEIDPDQPRVPAGLKARFRHYTNLTRTEARLRLLIEEFKFTTVRDVLVERGLLSV